MNEEVLRKVSLYYPLVMGYKFEVESGKWKVVYEEFRVPSLREN